MKVLIVADMLQSMFSDSLVEFVDILPTLVDAAGLPSLDKCPQYSRDVPICREGTSLLGIAGILHNLTPDSVPLLQIQKY